MTFEVHPHAPNNPPIEPYKVDPGGLVKDTVLKEITQIDGPSTIPDVYPKMMFIRVAVFGTPTATPPLLLVQCGTGPKVQAILNPSTPVPKSADPADVVADVKLMPGQLTNVQLIRIGFYDAASAESWNIGIYNPDATERKYTWVVAGTEAETAQPWLSVPTGALSITSLVNRPNETPDKIIRISRSVQVSNYGTAPLNVDALNPALPATLEAVGGPPFTVAPGESADLVLRYTPPTTGPTQLSRVVTLTSTPADTTAGTTGSHNKTFQIQATAQRLEVVMLLDDSGSMGTDPLGGQPATPATSRWGELVSAANPFLDLLAFFGSGRGKFGIARFPAPDPTNPSTYDVVPMSDITTDMSAAQTKVSAIVPFNGTPMGDGLFRVLGPTSYFSNDKLNRRWLILMSDGAHNSGTHQPQEFIAAPNGTAPAGTSLDDKDISLFSVAYGIDGFTDVNPVLLKELATGSQGGGQFRAVDQEGVTATTLSSQIRDTIKSGLTAATSPLDPTGVFVIGSGEKRHEVVLTEYDDRAAFILSWNTPQADRLRLELITPGCGLITPENAGTGRYGSVVYKAGDRSAMYLVDTEYLRHGGGSTGGGIDLAGTGGSGGGEGTSAAGTWTFKITSPDGGVIFLNADGEGGGQDTETYVYDTIVESGLKVEVAPDRPTYFAGQPITISARITADGKPIRDAAVTMSTTKPAESFTNWLAGLKVPDAALKQAQERLAGKDASPLLVKQLAAQIAGLTFGGGTNRFGVAMTDKNNDGVYSATFTNTSVPERYTFYVTAFGVTDDGVSFRREGKQETFVEVLPSPQFTQLDITTISPGVCQVTAIPQDQFGNVVLIDPAVTGGFGVVAPDAKVGPLVSGLDGTYTTTVTFDPKQSPQIGFQTAGSDVVKPVRTFPLAELRYPDKVVQYNPGPIIKSNKHDNPKAALGSVAEKPTDKFVSLGARGSVILAIKRTLILAEADEDVTVFVAAQAERRSYRVEAFSLIKGDWVELGSSVGTTMSFGLAAAGLKFTPAIRITDTSNVIRDADLKPLDAPGAGVRGFGALRTTRDIPRGRWNWPHWWDHDDRPDDHDHDHDHDDDHDHH